MINVVRHLAKAFERFVAHDGWAIASHIALSVLMSLFPFLIILTALAGLFGSAELADEAAGLLLEAWPREVAVPVANEVRSVLTGFRRDALALGAILALYFASSGVESLRVGLNRAYETYEWRAWWQTRLESIGYVIAAAVALLAFAVLIIFGPLVLRGIGRFVPWLADFTGTVAVLRVMLASLAVIAALIIAHRWLPGGRIAWRVLWPGIIFTLGLWMISGFLFGAYLDSFAGAYVTTYAGLATAMIALVFLYWLAAIFLLGAELNGAIEDARHPPRQLQDTLSTF